TEEHDQRGDGCRREDPHQGGQEDAAPPASSSERLAIRHQNRDISGGALPYSTHATSSLGGQVIMPPSVLARYVLPLTLPALPAAAQEAPARTLIHAGRLIDGLAEQALPDQGILIEGERIVRVGPWAELHSAGAGATLLDLSGMTVLPGLIDNHTHVLLQGDITSEDYDEQRLKESIPYRTIRATMAARTALDHGFTTLRDLETEGAMYADVDLRNAINRGVIPGPRLYVATRAFSATGMYPLSG